MSDVPEAAGRVVGRGVAAYLRRTPAAELPPSLAALKKAVQSPKGEARHRDRLLSLLDDEALRAQLLHWLQDGKTSLSKEETAALELAVARPEGWADRLAAATVPASSPPAPTTNDADIRRRLEREKEAHRKARDDLKAERDAHQLAMKRERQMATALEKRVAELERQVAQLESSMDGAGERAEKAAKDAERVKRKARAEVEDLEARVKQHKEENRALKKRIAELQRAAASATSRSEPRRAAGAPTAGPARQREGKRRTVLKAPKGRLAEAPETLEQWLGRPGVTLVVDGYNVTRSPEGYPQLSLEQQRNRLRTELKSLSTRVQVPTVLVWDGGDVPPGTKRRASGLFREEYSPPDRSGSGTDKDRADRHIVALLKKLGPDPVVVVTSDKGLQDQASAQRATIATSEQLLAHLR